ncbi:MAG: hypothetical protein JXA23_12700, partial [Bacteroidales bacterium]|nr:hypothetical protein [Bacteroidales bacterium]
IRKISGASIPEILALITRKFMLWTAISVILASAAGWWVMERWLEGFTFRIPLGASSFILSGMLALVVVLTIVCLITFRIALLNPAQTLKYE